MEATGKRFGAFGCTASALALAVFAGYLFTVGGQGDLFLGILVLVFAGIFALVGVGLSDEGGACYVSSEGVAVSLVQDQIYETVSCALVGKDNYVAVVKDTHGTHWACYVTKALPPVFVVRSGEERYVPFGKDFGKAAVPTESQTS